MWIIKSKIKTSKYVRSNYLPLPCKSFQRHLFYLINNKSIFWRRDCCAIVSRRAFKAAHRRPTSLSFSKMILSTSKNRLSSWRILEHKLAESTFLSRCCLMNAQWGDEYSWPPKGGLFSTRHSSGQAASTQEVKAPFEPLFSFF